MHYVGLLSNLFLPVILTGFFQILQVLQLFCRSCHLMTSRKVNLNTCQSLRRAIIRMCPYEALTLPMLRLLCPKHKDAQIIENHLNPAMLVFIGKHLLSTLRWVPLCQGFNHFSGYLHHFELAKLVTSSIRVDSRVCTDGESNPLPFHTGTLLL